MREVQVVVVGAGPVGLSTAVQLGRAGISCLVLERRTSLSRHPKAGGIHARTMEIFRQWGIADEIRSRGPQRMARGWGWMTRLNGIELGRMEMGVSAEEQALFDSQSPELMAGVGQDLFEPVIAQAAASYPTVEILLGREVGDIRQDDDGVTVSYADGDSAVRVRGQFVVAADGTRSAVRRMLGIGEHGQQSLGEAINVRFEADMEPHRKGRDYGLFWIVNADTQGAFLAGDGSAWRYNFEAAPGVDGSSYTDEQCADLIRAAIGADIPIEITSILYWQHDQAVTDRWRDGRIFLAGDSAHRFPPHGGFGMNSGVQDSQNLAWKLIASLRWGAGDRLLQTYEQERQPVAEFNGEQCMINTRKMEETGWLVNDPALLAEIETDAGRELRDAITAAIPKQREQFFSQGQQFGVQYDSSAVVPDGTDRVESTVSDYRPNGRPGARAPHLWVHRDGRRISTIDLAEGGFILLAGPDCRDWTRAASMVRDAGGPSMSLHSLGGAGDPLADLTVVDLDAALRLYGIDRSGALLIRPDGYVGYRASSVPEHPFGALAEAFTRILDLSAGKLFERASLSGASA